MAPGDTPFQRWLYRRKLLVIVLFALLMAGLLLLCLVSPVPLDPRPTRMPVKFIVPPYAGTTVPGAYVAWAGPNGAIPPTREPADPLAPGNQVLGFDCLSYLGSGSDEGIAAVWDNPNAINWRPYDTCLESAATRTVKLPDGRTIPQPVILTIPSTFADAGARWYNTPGHGAAGTLDNPLIRLHLPPWMQNDTYRFTFQVPESGLYYQSVRYDGAFKTKMIEFVKAAGARYNANSQVSAVRIGIRRRLRAPIRWTARGMRRIPAGIAWSRPTSWHSGRWPIEMAAPRI
jgi:hypothetical protein